LLPEPTVDREVIGGALAARPLVGVDLLRPIGVVQRRGKELGKTAKRFMQLLLKQSPSSREIGWPQAPDLDMTAAEDVAAEAAPDSDGSSDAVDLKRDLATVHVAT
jgi:hypothetical protein